MLSVNCVWGTWDTWATCSKTCGGGSQIRTRKITTHEENGGTSCTGTSSEQQNCNTGACPAGEGISDNLSNPQKYIESSLSHV